MFRTLTLIAALSAVAVPAAAASELRVKLDGKTDAQVRAEVTAAAREVCASYNGHPLNHYLMGESCVTSTVSKAMADVAAIKLAKATPAPTPTPTLTSTPVGLK